jgi:GNAT superfamily N-acetyltransferase
MSDREDREDSAGAAGPRSAGKPGQDTALTQARRSTCVYSLLPAREDQIPEVRKIIREYAESSDLDLGFQSFEEELEALPGKYAPPDGSLIVARLEPLPGRTESEASTPAALPTGTGAAASGDLVGCVALRRIDATTCEMKRLFVRDRAKGLGIGRALVERILTEARAKGYRSMKLDTLRKFEAALALYRQAGFRETAPYIHNPLEGAVFMELDLTVTSAGDS